MNRLTRKGTTKIHLEDYLMNGRSIDIQDCLNKLGKLEDLEEELGCPLDLVLIPYYLSDLKKVWYHNQWCDVVRVVAYEEATTPYMEVRCKDYDYLKFIPLANYKKTFWLKEDKSE